MSGTTLNKIRQDISYLRYYLRLYILQFFTKNKYLTTVKRKVVVVNWGLQKLFSPLQNNAIQL